MILEAQYNLNRCPPAIPQYGFKDITLSKKKKKTLMDRWKGPILHTLKSAFVKGGLGRKLKKERII